jgi:uncharacterized lipoprotein YmbA
MKPASWGETLLNQSFRAQQQSTNKLDEVNKQVDAGLDQESKSMTKPEKAKTLSLDTGVEQFSQRHVTRGEHLICDCWSERTTV